MTLKTPMVVALSLILGGCATSNQQAHVSDLNRAVAIAALAAEQEGYPLHEYTLTSAQKIINKSPNLNSAQFNFNKSPYLWRITFKPNALHPDDPSKEPIGLGGELFVHVDLGTQKVEILHGE